MMRALFTACLLLHSVGLSSCTFGAEHMKQLTREEQSEQAFLKQQSEKWASVHATPTERAKLIALGVRGTADFITEEDPSAKPPGAKANFDCKVKKLAYDFADKLLNGRGKEEVFSALQLGALCGYPSSPSQRPRKTVNHDYKIRKMISKLEKRGVKVYKVHVDSKFGHDRFDGSAAKPLRSIQHGLLTCRQVRRDSSEQESRCVVSIREGTYKLSKSLVITPEDSGTILTSYKGEQVQLSSGVTVKPDWQKHRHALEVYEGWNPLFEGIKPKQSTAKVSYIGKYSEVQACNEACGTLAKCTSYTYFDNTTKDFSGLCYFRVDGYWNPFRQAGVHSGKKINIYKASLADYPTLTTVDQVFINGRRAVRARYPNANPETEGLHTIPAGYIRNAVKWLPAHKKPDTAEIHLQSPTRPNSLFPGFQIGIGGSVDQFDPPQSYWGTKHPVGGGGSQYSVPSGLQYADDLEMNNRTWKNASTGIVHAFQHYHWGNWMYKLDGRDEKAKTLKWTWGGFQEARGAGDGKEFYVENIFEELDVANEWFYDHDDKMLYYFPNGTDNLPKQLEIPQLDNLITVLGTKERPVRNTVFHGLKMQHTTLTFLKPYMVPSGGDWSVHPNAMVYVEGTEHFVIQNCEFDAPGGNGIYVSKYNRNATIQENTFYRLGDNGISLVGDTHMMDGTQGEQPRGTKVLYNLMWENGIWGKQTYSFCQSRTAETLIEGNVFFNGPRAALNINDGFGGGNEITNNLLFNFVRETDDHGPINSWDRVPYMQTVLDGKTYSLKVKQNLATYNFIINNYRSVWPIDHDDGSCYWADSNNYMIYGGFKNYLGHDKQSLNNFYIYPDDRFCADTRDQGLGTSGYGDVFMDNVCVSHTPNDMYRLGNCDVNNLRQMIPFFANNRYYTTTGNITIDCSGNKWTLDQFQARGFDIGTTVQKLPSDDTIIKWGKDLFKL